LFKAQGKIPVRKCAPGKKASRQGVTSLPAKTISKESFRMKGMTADLFREYQAEVVGQEDGMHGRLAALLGTSEIGVKRFATSARPIPDYIAQSLRAMVLLHRKKELKKLAEMP